MQRHVMVPWYDALFATNPTGLCVALHSEGCCTVDPVPGMSCSRYTYVRTYPGAARHMCGFERNGGVLPSIYTMHPASVTLQQQQQRCRAVDHISPHVVRTWQALRLACLHSLQVRCGPPCAWRCAVQLRTVSSAHNTLRRALCAGMGHTYSSYPATTCIISWQAPQAVPAASGAAAHVPACFSSTATYFCFCAYLASWPRVSVLYLVLHPVGCIHPWTSLARRLPVLDARALCGCLDPAVRWLRWPLASHRAYRALLLLCQLFRGMHALFAR